MHWLEGAIMVAAGFIPWFVAAGKLPADPQKRLDLERAMPIVKNKTLLRVAAAFLWILGGAAILGFVR
ncbi:MAG: hypothetical protein A2X56_04760 [Nitrospirae bacterium GWC2_57_13]|jgi:hypothetical protein|nr:MAG: hypothetical protein A2072_02565 [Nitrospirae bacterium GWC1_57_7]OGW29430.1 MAG: hypothetical protein A2X56_04760 [Nitrospirae bacterium GWC2_57_13]OGW43355.1 MAG: hypothetical protein A2X57_00055 [Nitrospirae bacterium GWD2_57_8]HAR46310.1 hypothetical protein [Nitrospiraceae bacterium]HAS52929.1 hypothetical protein [Nitrospiraceae bacterium]